MLETFLTDGIDSTGMLAATASVTGLFIGLTTLGLARTLQAPAVVRSCTALLLLILAGVQVTLLDAVPASEYAGLFQLAIIATGLLSVPLLVPRGAFSSGTLTPVGRWRLPLGLFAVSFALYASFLSRPDVGEVALPPDDGTVNRDLVVEPSAVAYTDQNTRIPMYLNAANEAPAEAGEIDYMKKAKLDRQVIRLAGPDPRSNCHGWVFTDGRYHVKGENVDQILRDNGYELVPEPAMGDLIVYRGVGGEVLHTGVVRAVGTNGLVFIESKWGILGRYLHQPADQCFGQNFTYYRSSRPGHLLSSFAR